MLKDLEGNEVSMELIENRHIKVTGKSGTGKTYWVCQEIGKFVFNQTPVLIVDFSGSYTDREVKCIFKFYLARVNSIPVEFTSAWIFPFSFYKILLQMIPCLCRRRIK